MFCSPTYPQLRDTSLRTFKELSDELGGRIQSINHNDGICKISTNDGGTANVTFRSTEREEFLRGPNLSGVWFDEASLMREEAFDIVIASLREAGEVGWISLTFTPKGRHHWTYKLFHGDGIKSAELIQSSTQENPFLSRDFIDLLETRYSADKRSQELGGQFIDLSDQLVSYESMIQCTHPVCLWSVPGVAPHSTGLLYVGWDIGRSRDRSVIWTWEREGDVAWCRECFVMQNVAYDVQEAELYKRIRRPNVAKIVIDKGFSGGVFVERLQRELGERRVEGVSLSGAMQGHLAELLANAFDRRRVRIPDVADIRDDFALVGQTQVRNGTAYLPADAVQRSETLGHADRFWAAAMAYKGFTEGAELQRIAAPITRIPSWR